jgi:alanine racemase
MHIPYFHPAWIEVDLSLFKNNILAIKKFIQNKKLCLPVKANAYGHGLVQMAQAAEEYGVDYLAVSCLQEGILLRNAKISLPILVLGAIHEEQIPDLINYDLEFTIASKFKADLVEKQAKLINKNCKIHIEVETGMQRTGLRCESAEKLVEYLYNSSSFQICGIYTHMATADIKNHTFAYNQIKTFENFIEKIRNKYTFKFIAHMANSGGVCYFPESHFDMVRAGLLAFGYFEPQLSSELQSIVPFFSLKAKVAYFKVVPENSGISYNHTYITQKQTRIVTIPVGYGDGYRRALSNRAEILLRGRKYKISGNICMDQFMVDIGDHEAYIGDEVVIIGKQDHQQITVQDIANLCQTIPYEILCAFNERIPRVYVKCLN